MKDYLIHVSIPAIEDDQPDLTVGTFWVEAEDQKQAEARADELLPRICQWYNQTSDDIVDRDDCDVVVQQYDPTLALRRARKLTESLP